MKRTSRHRPVRAGTVLIMVAGISALIASLALAFLVRMRSDIEESDHVVRMTQAHVMLAAACNYIQEASRLGWQQRQADGTIIRDEGFGWIDVRDGFMGPKAHRYTNAEIATRDPLTYPSPHFPIGTIARFPMYVMERPPFAIKQTVAANPIATSGATSGLPLATSCDPLPLVADLWDDGQQGLSGKDYVHGDQRPRPGSGNASWFRVHRDGPATFLVSCGCGGTEGFRSWSDVIAAGKAELFGGDPAFFQILQQQEVRLWYRVEWSAAVASNDYQNIQNDFMNNGGIDYYLWRAKNANQESSAKYKRSQPNSVNLVGTIRWVQRLLIEPSVW